MDTKKVPIGVSGVGDGKGDEKRYEKGDERRFTCLCKLLILAFLLILAVVIVTVVVFIQPLIQSRSANESVEPPPTFTYNTTITLDPRLSRSFWGIDYTPLGTMVEHGCGVTQADVIEDLKLMSQLTSRIRLYGMDCNQAGLVMNGIKELNLDMGVVFTIWVDKNQTTYERQYATFWDVIERYGTDQVLGVSIGNEAIFRKDIGVQALVDRVREVKNEMKARGYKDVPVFTTEITDLPMIIPHEDMVYNNIHPFFGGTLVDDAADWTWRFFFDASIVPMHQLASKGMAQKPAIISEIGWPSNPISSVVKGAVPSTENQKKLLDMFVCESNRRGVPYFWFEFKDEPWKQYMFNETREAYWGIFDKDRQLKHKSMPNCPVESFRKGDRTVPLVTRLS